ncbi:MAG: hypothetical protein L0Y61_05825 [Epsilonproteobacteria bacterium]|nr:hypothetical protein [Campylobacterota bacterium]
MGFVGYLKIGISSITIAELYYGVKKEVAGKLERYSFDENAAVLITNNVK